MKAEFLDTAWYTRIRVIFLESLTQNSKLRTQIAERIQDIATALFSNTYLEKKKTQVSHVFYRAACRTGICDTLLTSKTYRGQWSASSPVCFTAGIHRTDDWVHPYSQHYIFITQPVHCQNDTMVTNASRSCNNYISLFNTHYILNTY